MRVLIIEDDITLGQFLKKKLGEAGFAADWAKDGLEGESLGREQHYQAVVLDLGLPGRSGLEVLANWRRQRHAVPVIILTARNAWQERVQGIEAGADDYLGKPFHWQELLARLRALILRSATRIQAVLTAGGLTLDETRQAVQRTDDTWIQLSGTEFRLLRVFMLHAGKVLSKEFLLEAIYNYDAEVDPNIIEVYVNHLRRKLGRSCIRTLRWQGYRFDGDAPQNGSRP